MDGLPDQTQPAAITDVAFDWFMLQVTRLRSLAVPGWLWVVGLWLLFAFPGVALRGAHYEEGTVIGLARGALEDGHWLVPHLYGERFAERPVLLSWIAAAIGAVSGGVGVWSVRIPHLLGLLAGGLLVYRLVRPLARTAPAVFGAACWFASPMVAQKFVTAEPDVTMSVLLFGAFTAWWTGASAGRVSRLRWLAVAVMLAAAGLTKGPQPIAYFTLGVGAYLLMHRRRAQWLGFAGAHFMAVSVIAAWYLAIAQSGDVDAWLSHSRLNSGMSPAHWLRDHLDFVVSLVVEWLPASLLLVTVMRALRQGELAREADLLLALLLYAGLASAVLLLWPGGVATRYAMPASPALAAVAGILYPLWWRSHPWLIAACNTVVVTVASYLVLAGVVAMTVWPDAFRQSRNAAHIIESLRATRPGVFYASAAAANMNVLAYLAGPIRVVPVAHVAQLEGPALVWITAAELASLSQAPDRADRAVVVLTSLPDKTGSRIVDIRRASRAP